MSLECDCPSWVRRCAHFDDHRIWLLDKTSPIEVITERGYTREDFANGCPMCHCTLPGAGLNRYVVAYGRLDEPHCACKIQLTCQPPVLIYANSREEADAEFNKLEEEMMSQYYAK